MDWAGKGILSGKNATFVGWIIERRDQELLEALRN
jgi:hypothetical protein